MGATQSYDLTTLPDEAESPSSFSTICNSQCDLSPAGKGEGEMTGRKTRSSSSTASEMELQSISEISTSIVPIHVTTRATSASVTVTGTSRILPTAPPQINGSESTQSSSTSQQTTVLSAPTDTSTSTTNASASAVTQDRNLETTHTSSPTSSSDLRLLPSPSSPIPSTCNSPNSLPFSCSCSVPTAQHSFQNGGISSAEASSEIQPTTPRREIPHPRADEASRLAALAERQPPPYSVAISGAVAAPILESPANDTAPRLRYPTTTPITVPPPIGPPPAYDEPGYEFPPPPLARRRRARRLSSNSQTLGDPQQRPIFFSDVMCVICCAVCLAADIVMNRAS